MRFTNVTHTTKQQAVHYASPPVPSPIFFILSMESLHKLRIEVTDHTEDFYSRKQNADHMQAHARPSLLHRRRCGPQND